MKWWTAAIVALPVAGLAGCGNAAMWWWHKYPSEKLDPPIAQARIAYRHLVATQPRFLNVVEKDGHTATTLPGPGLRPAKRWLARRDWRSERGQRFPKLNGKGLGPNMWRVR